jgi:hypothetical protein
MTPPCGTYWRFKSNLRTHPATVVLMREDRSEVNVRDLRTGERWMITPAFFHANYEQAR